MGKGGGIAPERGLPAKQQHGRRHLQQSAGDATQRILQGSGVVLHAAHAASLCGFSVASLGDEVENLLADVLLDGEGADLLLNAADLLESLLSALAPVGLARLIAALDREVVLAISIGQLLICRLHLFELLGSGVLSIGLRSCPIPLGCEGIVVLLLGGSFLLGEVDQPGTGDGLLIQLCNELAIGFDLLLGVSDLLIQLSCHG